MNGFDLNKTAWYFEVDKNSITEIFYEYDRFGIYFKQPAWNDKSKIEIVDLNVKMPREEALERFGIH